MNLIKEITTKAENEMAVRSAIDEIAHWLKNEAKISFAVCPFSIISK
jgi:hypothetical protein